MLKKGFPLISIIKVLGIISVVVLLSGFFTLNVVDKIRKKSFIEVSYGIISAAELKYAYEVFKGSSGEIVFNYDNGVESNKDGKTLDYNGECPKHGIIKINSIGQISIALHDGKYCITKDFEDGDVTINIKNKKDCYKDK